MVHDLTSMTTQLNINVKKRNGRIDKFNEDKIYSAVYKAMCAIGKPDKELAKTITTDVVNTISDRKLNDFGVEDVQDVVETVLIERGVPDVAKAFILYRDSQRLLREEKCKILNKKDLDEVDKAFDPNSLRVLASRYLLKNSNNEIVESPKELFIRVATHIGLAEIFYDPLLINPNLEKIILDKSWVVEAENYYHKLDNFDQKLHIGEYYLNKYHFEALIRQYVNMFKEGKIKVPFRRVLELVASGHFDKLSKTIDQFYDVMVNRVFLPNTPTLMNAGARLAQLSACFTLGMDDSLESIMKTSKDAAIIFQSGGGVGINYGTLRCEGDTVSSTSGVASGPVSFMSIVNTITEVVKQGGKRRGANMGIIDCWHGDIEKFITTKTTPGVLENFNVSVGIWKDFWDALVENKKYQLKNPRNGKVVNEIDPRQLLDTIALSAWKSAEPGIIFFDNVNDHNPMIKVRGGPISVTNPCGEQAMYPSESCNLGSINLAKFVDDKKFDWEGFESTIRLCTRFLDNVVDVNKYPIDEITKASRETRRIGLGIMGLADMMYLIDIPYNSEEGYKFMDTLAETLSYITTDESVELARQRGEFDLFRESDMSNGDIQIAGMYGVDHNKDWKGLREKIVKYGIRNSWNTTIAPTGSLSMIADCSNGVEPTFSIAFEKHIAVGKFYYSNKIFKDVMSNLGIYSEELLQKVVDNYGSVKGVDEIPSDIQDTFVTAMDIHWIDHVVAQAVWQRWIGNAISKTINMPGYATSEDIRNAYLISHDLGLKGVTVYRDGSRHEQVLHIKGNKEKSFEVEPSVAATNYVLRNVRAGKISEYVLNQVNKYFVHVEHEDAQSDKISDIIPHIIISSSDFLNNVLERVIGDECPTCKEIVVRQGGCKTCVMCGWSGCSSS